MAHAIDPWPFWYPHRGWILSRLHRALAHAYIAIRTENPLLYSGLLLEQWQEVVRHLSPIGGRDWARAMVSLSIAYAENLAGTHADNIERAIETVETVLGTLHPDRDREEWIEATANLATYYTERRRGGSRTENVEESIRLLEHLHHVVRAHGTRLQVARTLVLLGSSYAQRRKFDREENMETAIEYLEKGLWALGADVDPHTWSSAQLNLCLAYSMRLRGDPKENHQRAVEASDRCLAGFEQLGERAQWARALMIRFSLFEDAPSGAREENWEEAIRRAEQALTVFTADAYPEEHIEIRRALDQIRSRRYGPDRPATLEEVIRDTETTLSQLSPERNPSHYASLLTHLGNAYAERVEGVRAENMERSIELLEHAVSLLDERAEPAAWAGAMNNLAQSYQERVDGLRADNIEKALAISEEALVVVSAFSEPEMHSALLETLGTGFFERVRGDRRRNLQTAVEVHGRAQVRRDVNASSEAWLRLQHKYRQAQWALGRIEQREEREHGERSAEMSVEDFEQYLARLRKAAGLVSAQEYPRTWVAAQLELGDAFTRFAPPGIENGPHALARAIYAQCEKALPIYESTMPVVAEMREDDRWALVQERVAITHRMMYGVTRFSDDPGGSSRERARKHYELALAAYGEVLKIRSIAASPRKHLGASVDVARLHVYEGDWSRASEQFESAAVAADRLLGDVELSESETKDILRDLGVIAGLAPFVSLMLGRPERAVALAEAGRARLLAKSLTLEALPLPAEDRDALRALQRGVIAQERRLTSPRLFDRRTPLEESVRLRREIRELIDRTNPGARLEGFSTEALSALVRDGSVIVIPMLTDEGGRIVVCTEDGDETRFHVAECRAAHALREIFESPRTHGEGGWKQQYLRHTKEGIPNEVLRDFGRSLGEIFATPLVELLEALGIPDGTHLDILPQGPLGIMPAGLAVDAKSEIPLCERYELSFTPSLTALAHAKMRATQKPASLLAVLDPKLPSTRAEEGFLRGWFPRGDYLNARVAAPEEITQTFAKNDLWHFGMHGTFDAKVPLRSGLSFGDHGRLTLDRLFATGHLGSPRLVVLSACETGLYDIDAFPDELLGLPVGFLQAGAAGVIATLWPVEDASTALLMGRFYEAYLGEGRTPSAALRIAQLWLRSATKRQLIAALPPSLDSTARQLERLRDIPYASPKYWGGFVHYGA